MKNYIVFRGEGWSFDEAGRPRSFQGTNNCNFLECTYLFCALFEH